MIMASQEKILDAVLSLNSSKKKEKLEAFENLIDLLNQNCIIKSLHESSLANEKNINWSILFIRVHNAAMSLIDEKSTKTRQLSDKNIQVIKSVLQFVVQQSMHQKVMLISSSLIVGSVLSVFETDFRSKLLGSTYFTIFSKYILLERRNWNELKKEHWFGMKELCKKLTKNPLPGTHCTFFLEILCEIIKNSCKNCQISHDYLDLFTFLREVFSSCRGMGINNEIILLRLTNMLCLQLAVEYRYKACEFTEDVFDYVVSFHRKNNTDLNILIYHFLMITISIHNPHGVSDGERSFYAFNSHKWKKQVLKMFLLCSNSIKEIVKSSCSKINMEFLDLFVDVTHLVFICGIQTDGVDDEPKPAKIRKMSHEVSNSYNKILLHDFSIENLVNNLVMEDNWFWLKYLEIFSCKYPVDLKNWYLPIVKVLCQLFYDKKSDSIVSAALRCLYCILQAQSKVELPKKDGQLINEALITVSEELLRSMQLEKYTEAHTLIQALIKHSKLIDPVPLLKLYCNNTLKGSTDNFNTLAVICQNSNLPEGIVKEGTSKEENVRKLLLTWLIEGNDHYYPCKDLAKLLVVLISRKLDEEKAGYSDKQIMTPHYSTISDFCKLITHNYRTVAFQSVQFRIQPKLEVGRSVKVDSSLKLQMVNLLKDRWEILFEALAQKESDFDKELTTLNNCFWFCELICHVLSHMETINESLMNDTNLMKKFKVMMNACTTKTLDFLGITFFDLGPISKIYSGRFHEEVGKFIRQPEQFNIKLLDFFFDVLVNGNSNGTSIVEPHSDLKYQTTISNPVSNAKWVLDFGSLTKSEKILVSAVEFLSQYVTIPGSQYSNEFLSNLALKVITALQRNDTGKAWNSFRIQLTIRVISIFSEHDGLDVIVLKECLNFVRNILEKLPLAPELINTVLEVSRKLLPLVDRSGDHPSRQTYMQIVGEMRDAVLSREWCGIKAARTFVECLAEIHAFDPEGRWTNFETEGGKVQRAADDVLSCLKHSYHEVRLEAALLIGSLLIVDRKMAPETITRQEELLKKVLSTLTDNSGRFPKGTDCVYDYVTDVTTSASLLTLAGIICRSTFWRKRTFFDLFRLTFLKNWKQCDVREILKLIYNELEITNSEDYFKNNLGYLLEKWADEGLRIEDFPFHIVGCKSLKEFLCEHRRVVVMVYSQSGQLQICDIVSVSTGLSLGNVALDCYSMILAVLLDREVRRNRSSAVDNVMKLRQLVEDTAPSEAFSNYTARHLGKIVLHMIESMHDRDYLVELGDFFGNFEDDSNPLALTAAEIMETVANTLNARGKPLLEEIILERPSVIEKMSSRLMEKVARAIIYQDRVFAFYKYVFFVEMVSSIIGKSQEYRGIGTFFIRDVLYSLFGILQKDDGDTLTNLACECLKKLTESCLNEFGDIFGEFLPLTTTVLIPLALKSNRKASTVLHCLICDNYSTFEKNLALVDPFPPHETFQEINERIARTEATKTKSLENRIKHFLELGSNRNSGCRIEGLQRLRESLADKKDELTAMYDALTTLRGFSEDCQKSLLHRLICVLVELTMNKNVLVKMEAARCLGELGPSDLTTLVLRPENNFPYLKTLDTPVNTLLMSSLNFLSNLLTTDNFWVKNAASKALYAVLSVRQGQEVHRSHTEEYRNFTYLVPFKSEKSEDLRLRIKKKVVLQNLGDEGLWRPIGHVEWMTRLVDQLLQCLSDPTGIVDAFRAVISISCDFAEHLLPLLLDLIISSGDKECAQIISNHFRGIFEDIFNQKNNVKSAVINRKSIQCLLNVVDYIRTRRHNDGIYEEACLDVNYLHLAEAAMSCSAFFTAIFYAELWFEQKRKGKYFEMNVNTVCELFPDEGFALTQILRECHWKLGNSDGIHGCGYMHILELPAEIQHYEHVGNWNLCLLHYDIELSMGNRHVEGGLLNSLERSGMLYVLHNLAKTSNDSGKPSDTLYKCATRLSDWSLLDTVASKPADELSSSTFHKSFYFALKAFHNEDDLTMQSEIQKATKTVLNKLVDCSLESSKNLYLPIAELQTVKEFEEFVSVVRQNPNKSNLWTLFNKWQKQDNIRCGDFTLKESILTNRMVFLKLGLEKMESSSIADDLRLMLYQTSYNIIATSRKERKFDSAMRMLNYVNAEEKVPQEIREKLKLEKSRILWERGDKDIGRFVLSHLIKKEEITGNLKGKCLRIYGDWMAKTKLESSPEIIGNYYLKSIALSSGSRPPVDAYASLAKFADSNYEQLNEYLSSPLFEIKQSLINTQQDLASELRQELGWNKTQNREKRMAYQIVSKQSLIDENEIKNNKSERDSYLCLALRYYLMTLRAGEKYNLFVFRVISLWLSNSGQQNVIEHLKKLLPQIPTYKFLCLLPQLVPRMADVCLISYQVERILQDHPYHTLPHLFALSNSYEDVKYSGDRKPWMTTPRVQAAQSILDKCLKSGKLQAFIHEMRSFSTALIELANYHPPDRGSPGLPIHIPDHLNMKRIKNLSTVPVPSISLPYEKEGRYEAVVSVHRFEESFYLVGGINLPKRIKCIGSDGIGRSLLVKGKDDLRQDAVMQQVFTIMNSLLSENTETKKRKLIIRTYRVVPLSQRSGIIEWCENTQPMSLYLTGSDGKSGAHKKFYPDDMTAWECRSLMRKVFAKPGATNADKLNTYLNVCKQFHPVFHYFFLENFPQAGVWFERRLAYIHSVATSSMIGYVLGIGDRHMHNILIDNATAEVIHIDLGIAFEQGKTLPIPETVPFRLTRDVVDGMGLIGVEGDFRISCVKTMQVLRENQDTILTLLEVLLYDPVHTWTVTPEKAYSMQGQAEASSSATEKSSPDFEINKMAERALMRLKQKLEGTEAGWVATNVEGQVSYLVQQARDPNNLCKLFHGWQPYL